MKLTIKLNIAMTFFLFLSKTNAQIDLGFQTGIGFNTSYGLSVPLGIRVDAIIKEQPFYAHLNYFIPKTSEDEVELNPLSSLDPTKTVKYTSKFNMITLQVGYKYFFGEAEYDVNGFYGLAELGLAYASDNTSTKEDVSLYMNPGFGKVKEASPYFALGIGYQVVNSNDSKLAFDLKFNSSSLQYNSNQGFVSDFEMPSFLGLYASYRFPLNN